jgi:hypothetical protein
VAEEVRPTRVTLAGEKFIRDINAPILEVLNHFCEVFRIFALDKTENILKLLAVGIADSLNELGNARIHSISFV